MSKIKSVVLTVVTTLCCITVLAGAVVCSRHVDTSPCEYVDIVIEDSLARQFVTPQELDDYLKLKGCYEIGQPINEIDCYQIEQQLLKHDMIRTANCYKTAYGMLRIAVTQRIPILAYRIGGETRLVDSDRRIMPYLCGMDSSFILLTGVLTENVVTNEYFDFIKWIVDDPYWNTRIANVHVKDPRTIVLKQNDKSYQILLGTLDEYPIKLKRLQNLYVKAFEQIGYPVCTELDLRFAGQVVKR
jgi:cell division protein FtsQ